jgi:hypothetical protein
MGAQGPAAKADPPPEAGRSAFVGIVIEQLPAQVLEFP